MNYHDIYHDDMLNGSDLGCVLFVSGCSHRCDECQNPQTWKVNSGIKFDKLAKEEVFDQLSKPYIKRLTLSGGDPLNNHNLDDVYNLVCEIKDRFRDIKIWVYTGFTFEEIKEDYRKNKIVEMCDVLIDGKYEKDKFDINYPWCGSTNQRVIDIRKSLEQNEIVLYEC